MTAIAVVALLALAGVSLAAAQGSEPKIPFTIAGNVIWADFWYDEMGGTRVPQLVSIYHLKEGTFTRKKGGYQGGILLAETVTDADGNYSITLEAAGMHKEQVTIKVDGFPTQSATLILADWHKDKAWKMDITWPGSWRPEDGNKRHSILRRAAQRGVSLAAAQGSEPKIPFTIAGNVIWADFWYDEMGGTRVPQLVSIYHLKEGTFTEKKDGYQGGILLAETVTDADGNYSITLEADGMHLAQVTIRVDGFPTQSAFAILADWHEGIPWEMDIGWPGDWRPEDGNNHPGILKELTAAQRAAARPTTPVQAIAEPADGTATEPAGPQAATTAPERQATQATATPAATDSAGPTPVPQPNYTPEPTSTPGPTAASMTPPAATPAQTPQQGGGNASGGCSIGDSGGTDLGAVMFGGAMLTGLGLLMVRRRKG